MDSGLTYLYIKQRKDFGKQPRFCEVPVAMLDSINPEEKEQNLFCLRNPVHQGMQTSGTLSEHYVNTKRIILHDQGINHAEGGWPKDINSTDEEATTRHRRRFERDESYVQAILNSYKKINHLIKQNNAIEMYNMYFKEMKSEKPVEKCLMRKTNVFSDIEKRPVASISWTHEDNSKLVVAYCNKNYSVTGKVDKSLSCSIWDIENPNDIFADILPPSACWQIVCSSANPNIIIGGLADGRVCIFDIRTRKEPIALSPTHLAHRDPVSALLFISSRINAEICSGSSDGKCMWWDIRSLSEPIDSLIMSIRIPPGEHVSMANAEAVSALQFDKAFPTRLLCGTDTGFIININRKGKTHQEIMSGIFQAHRGPVKTVQRNPSLSKMFITCGDWTVNIWSDDIHSNPVMYGTSHRKQVSDVAWCPLRISSYMSVCDDGKFRYWDLLRKYHEPVATLPVSKNRLLKVKPSEDKPLVAIGDIEGSIHLISLSENMVFAADRDKTLMSQSFDRESRREHILESRFKEIQFKLKADIGVQRGSTTEIIDEEASVRIAEENYRRMVVEEIRNTGATQYPRGRTGKMRKR
ncbi:unnamed protein product, partial [Brenthis ino]